MLLFFVGAFFFSLAFYEYPSDGVIEPIRWGKDDVILKNLLETNLRQRGIGNTNAVKLARCIAELERLYGIKEGRPEKLPDNSVVKNQVDLANELNVSIDQLQNYKRLLTLIPELQDLVEKDRLSPTIGYKVLSKLSKSEQEKLISDFGKDYIANLTQKKADELVKNVKPKVIDNTDYTTIDRLKKGKVNTPALQNQTLKVIIPFSHSIG
jgi:hypothetical protein